MAYHLGCLLAVYLDFHFLGLCGLYDIRAGRFNFLEGSQVNPATVQYMLVQYNLVWHGT